MPVPNLFVNIIQMDKSGLNSYTDGRVDAGGNAKMRKVGAVLAVKTSQLSGVRIKNVCGSVKRKNESCITTCICFDSQEVKNFDNKLITLLNKGYTIELVRIDDIMN